MEVFAAKAYTVTICTRSIQGVTCTHSGWCVIKVEGKMLECTKSVTLEDNLVPRVHAKLALHHRQLANTIPQDSHRAQTSFFVSLVQESGLNTSEVVAIK